MTDRICALTVTLEREMREDDIEDLVSAIRLLRGVNQVTEHVADPEYYSAVEHAKLELRREIFEALKPA